MIQFAAFPSTSPPPGWVERLVGVFRRHEDEISSGRPGGKLSSEAVLGVLSSDLEAIGFHIEKLKHSAKSPSDPAAVPAQGADTSGNIHFDVYQPEWMCCLAIEDGHGWANIDTAEDLVEPLLVSNVDTLCIAVPCAEEQASGALNRASEFERTCDLAAVVYGHTRVQLPKCLLIIGY